MSTRRSRGDTRLPGPRLQGWVRSECGVKDRFNGEGDLIIEFCVIHHQIVALNDVATHRKQGFRVLRVVESTAQQQGSLEAGPRSILSFSQA